MARSKANKIADGHKATQTKIARFGPREIERALSQQAWTISHRGHDKNENPYIRENVYSAEELERAKLHKSWGTANPGRSEAENPYSWRSGQPEFPS